VVGAWSLVGGTLAFPVLVLVCCARGACGGRGAGVGARCWVLRARALPAFFGRWLVCLAGSGWLFARGPGSVGWLLVGGGGGVGVLWCWLRTAQWA
jgi:hypothetical protein